MINSNLLIGLFAIGFGLYTLRLRIVRPSAFGKLQAMRERFGAKVGTGIHVVGYTVVPLVVGLLYLLAGLAGE